MFAHSAEVLTPVIRDPPSLIPLLRVATALLGRPASAAQISGHTIAYSVTQRAITRLCPPGGAVLGEIAPNGRS